MNPEAVGIVLCVLLFALIVGTLIGAIILRAGVSMYNTLAGSNSASKVPEPSMGHALVITLVTNVVNLVVGYVFGFAVGFAAVAAGSPPPTPGSPLMIGIQLCSIPIGLLVMSFMLSGMLPTTFMRAMLVSLCQLAISLAIALLIGVMLLLLAIAGGFLSL